jgi:hypothetical protein
MKEFCTYCNGVVCLKIKDGVYMKKDNNLSPEIVVGEINDCPKKPGNEEDIRRDIENFSDVIDTDYSRNLLDSLNGRKK